MKDFIMDINSNDQFKKVKQILHKHKCVWNGGQRLNQYSLHEGDDVRQIYLSDKNLYWDDIRYRTPSITYDEFMLSYSKGNDKVMEPTISIPESCNNPESRIAIKKLIENYAQTLLPNGWYRVTRSINPTIYAMYLCDNKWFEHEIEEYDEDNDFEFECQDFKVVGPLK